MEVTASGEGGACGRMNFSTVIRQRVVRLFGMQGFAHWTINEKDLKIAMPDGKSVSWEAVTQLDSQKARRGELEDVFGVAEFKDDTGIPVPRNIANKVK